MLKILTNLGLLLACALGAAVLTFDVGVPDWYPAGVRSVAAVLCCVGVVLFGYLTVRALRGVSSDE